MLKCTRMPVCETSTWLWSVWSTWWGARRFVPTTSTTTVLSFAAAASNYPIHDPQSQRRPALYGSTLLPHWWHASPPQRHPTEARGGRSSMAPRVQEKWPGRILILRHREPARGGDWARRGATGRWGRSPLPVASRTTTAPSTGSPRSISTRFAAPWCCSSSDPACCCCCCDGWWSRGTDVGNGRGCCVGGSGS
jgi:hypothetical protein